MTKHFGSSVITFLIAALFSTPIAPAVAKQQCSESAKAQGYWSWRMIDGRKCWYEGKPMLSKSLLVWSARPAAKAEPETVASVATEKPGDPMDAQARVIDTDSPAKAIGSETFDALWRARVGR